MTLPNIVLVTVDCLRYDRCGFNGHHRDTTPVLDQLAEEATIFDAAVAPGPRTSESVPGILSGLHSCECTYFDQLAYKSIPSNTPTLATWLSKRGYRTVAEISNPQLSPLRNFDLGFDTFENLRIETKGDQFRQDCESDDSGYIAEQIMNFRNRFRDPIRDRIKKNSSALLDPTTLAFAFDRVIRKRSSWPTIAGESVIDQLLSTLRTVTDDMPLFAWTHLNDLHAPIHPDRVRKGGLLNSPSDMKQFRWDSHRVANRYEPNYAAMYDSTLRYIDAQIGRLVDYFRDNNMWKNTTMIVTADHGEALHDRGIYGHAAGNDRYSYDSTRDYMYEELLHVPLLVREPNKPSQRVRSPFSLLWLHELIAEIADLEPGNFRRTSERQSHYEPSTDSIIMADAMSSDGHTIAVRQGSLKWISECVGGERGSIDGDPLLFNLETDPGERTNLQTIQSAPTLATAATDALRSPETLNSVSGEIDTETKDLLNQLGYT